MHRLSRQVRFSITPFLPVQPEGFNTYASKPTGIGLSIHLSLWVELEGKPDKETGFLVNVSEIDKVIRKKVVPVFIERIGAALNARRHISTHESASILKDSVPDLYQTFATDHKKIIRSLKLELNPYRSISINCCSNLSQVKDIQMFTYTEKFEFSAMHKLWNDTFSAEKNVEVFGKCANPAGHGHNYVIEAAVEIPAGDKGADAWEIDFQQTIKEKFIDIVDHRNLNIDVPVFQRMNPTVENIVSFAWECLDGQFKGVKLSKLTVWENDRTYCTFCKDTV